MKKAALFTAILSLVLFLGACSTKTDEPTSDI